MAKRFDTLGLLVLTALTACTHVEHVESMPIAIEGQDYKISSNNEFNDRRFGLLLSGTSEGIVCVAPRSWPRYNMVTRSRGRGGLSIANIDAVIEAVLPDGTTIAPRKHTRTALSFLGNDEEYLNSMIRLKEGATISVAIPYDYFDASNDELEKATHLNYRADQYLCD